MIELLFLPLAGIVYTLILIIISQAVLYVFQIKEYRFDRTISQVREDGLFGIFWKNIGKRGALTLRNVLIVLIASFPFIVVNSVFIQNTIGGNLIGWDGCRYFNPGPACEASIRNLYVTSLLWKSFYVVLLEPIVTIGVIILGVVLTEPLAQFRRNRLIAQASEKVKASRAIFIGISGTYGKSTTKEYLCHILSTKFRVGKTDENMNTDVGVAVSILKNLKPDTEYFVAEVGAYKLGEVRRAAAIFTPHAAIMLPFGNQHIDLFGSKDNLVAAESEILEFVPKDGRVYVNADIPELQYVLNHSRGAVTTYSITKKADIYATDIMTTEEGSSAKISYSHLTFTIETKLLGKHVIQNLLPAIAAAIDFGMSTADIAAAIETLPFVPGKLSLHEKNGAVILNDAGNTSVNGFLAAIDTIKLFNKEKIYILSKGIIELGREKNKSYKKIIIQIEKYNIGLATSDKLFKQFDTKNNVTIVQNEDDFSRFIASKLNSNTAVLLEGKFTKPFIEKLI